MKIDSKIITPKEALYFTKEVFEQLIKCKSTEDVDQIFDNIPILKQNQLPSDTYPPINFKIEATEINLLINHKLIDPKTYKFKGGVSGKITNTLTKLLYATVWKNGDLNKIHHIIKEIMPENDNNNEQNDALVFYQFGKYLTKQRGQPIIDQHVIRAFGVYKLSDVSDVSIEEVKKLQNLKQLNKEDHKKLIGDYIKWLKDREWGQKLKTCENYSYSIDKLLFATGKTIKSKKNKQS